MNCKWYEFRCLSGECVDIRSRCNRVIDCLDGSDEKDCVGNCLLAISLSLSLTNLQLTLSATVETLIPIPLIRFTFVLAIDVNVKLIPSRETVFLGDELQLNCSVNGDPMAQITWSMPYMTSSMPENIEMTNGLLSISRVRHENGGIYRFVYRVAKFSPLTNSGHCRCTVNTYAGKYNADYVLIIQGNPFLSMQ